MKKNRIVCLLLLTVSQCVGRDFNQYLMSGQKYGLVPEKREELATLINTGTDQERRGANALLAFEAVGKVQDNGSSYFAEAERLAKDAILSSTNDWINILAGVALVASHNLQRNQDNLANATNTLALLQKVTASAWEVSDNPLYLLWNGAEQMSAEKLREALSRSIIGNYCALYRFDDAANFLKTCPDLPWKRDAENNLALQRDEHARSLEEAEQIRLRQDIRKERSQ